MSKSSFSFSAMRTFFGEVSTELKKCAAHAPGAGPVVVIISVFLLGSFVAICDLILRELIKLVL